jgi:hypothetical protein
LSRGRFSIASLMFGIAYLGVGMAALRTPSFLWKTALHLLSGIVLAVGFLFATRHEGG